MNSYYQNQDVTTKYGNSYQSNLAEKKNDYPEDEDYLEDNGIDLFHDTGGRQQDDKNTNYLEKHEFTLEDYNDISYQNKDYQEDTSNDYHAVVDSYHPPQKGYYSTLLDISYKDNTKDNHYSDDEHSNIIAKYDDSSIIKKDDIHRHEENDPGEENVTSPLGLQVHENLPLLASTSDISSQTNFPSTTTVPFVTKVTSFSSSSIMTSPNPSITPTTAVLSPSNNSSSTTFLPAHNFSDPSLDRYSFLSPSSNPTGRTIASLKVETLNLDDNINNDNPIIMLIGVTIPLFILLGLCAMKIIQERLKEDDTKESSQVDDEIA